MIYLNIVNLNNGGIFQVYTTNIFDYFVENRLKKMYAVLLQTFLQFIVGIKNFLYLQYERILY